MMAAAAVAAVAAAAVIAVIAVALALFAAFRPMVGDAYGWAIVAAIFALVIALAGLFAAQGGRSRPRRRSRREEADAQTITERLLDIASDRPLASLGAALAAAIAMGVTLTRSPKSTGAIAKAFFETFLGRSERR